jgi:HAE1 family hydrophobic/amphiphilic exporter-1
MTLATLALVLLGSVSLGRLPVALLPDVALPVLTVRTAYPGAAAAEVSRLVAEPVEEAVAASPGLVMLCSESRSGTANTTTRLGWGTRMTALVLRARLPLESARTIRQAEAERLTPLTIGPGERPVANLTSVGPGDLRAAARTALDVHAPGLQQLADIVSSAIVDGSAERLDC